MAKLRLITRQTRPDLYAALDDTWRARNDNERTDNEKALRREYRSQHPFLCFIAYFSGSGWRIAALIATAWLIGSVAGLLLP